MFKTFSMIIIVLIIAFNSSCDREDLFQVSTDLQQASSDSYKTLIAYWKFDGNFNDFTEKNNASPMGSSSYSFGKDGNAANFDWTNWAEVSNPVGMNKDVYTITAWIKRYAHNTAPYIRLNGLAHIITDDNGFWKLRTEGNIDDVDFSKELFTFKWYHLTVVLDRTNHEVVSYVDGVHNKTIALANVWLTDPTGIKIGEHSSSFRWNGCIDDMRIYNIRLTDTQVLDLYNSYSTGTVEPSPAAPSGLTTAPMSDNSIQLTWTDNANNEHGFKIYRSQIGAAGPYTYIDTTLPNIQSYTDNTLNPSTPYYYQVRAFNENPTESSSNSASSTTYTVGTLPEKLAHWTFDGSNLNDLTTKNSAIEDGPSGSVPLTYDTGITGFACQFFGEGSNYGIVNSPSAGFTSDIYTIMAWVNRTTNLDPLPKTTPYLRLTGIGHFVADVSGKWIFKGENGCTDSVDTGETLNVGTWYHVTTVINRSAGTIKFYLNGSPAATPSASITPWQGNVSNIMIGRFDNSFIWHGYIDEMIIYGGELTAIEINNLYTAYPPPP